MADKELSDRIAAALEDAEATPDEELEWTRHREQRKTRPRSIAYAFQWIGSRSCASWRPSVGSAHRADPVMGTRTA